MSEVTYFQLRLPPELHEAVKALSDRDARSVHWEYLRLIRKALACEAKTTAQPAD